MADPGIVADRQPGALAERREQGDISPPDEIDRAGASLAAAPSVAAPGSSGDAVAMEKKLIKHIVIIVQENRSFDNMFNGYPGADTSQVGTIHTGQIIPLQQISLKVGFNIAHKGKDFFTSYDKGKLDGFDLVAAGNVGKPSRPFVVVPTARPPAVRLPAVRAPRAAADRGRARGSAKHTAWDVLDCIRPAALDVRLQGGGLSGTVDLCWLWRGRCAGRGTTGWLAVRGGDAVPGRRRVRSLGSARTGAANAPPVLLPRRNGGGLPDPQRRGARRRGADGSSHRPQDYPPTSQVCLHGCQPAFMAPFLSRQPAFMAPFLSRQPAFITFVMARSGSQAPRGRPDTGARPPRAQQPRSPRRERPTPSLDTSASTGISRAITRRAPSAWATRGRRGSRSR